MSDDLIREVNDAVQREQWFGVVKRYGVAMGVVAVLAVAVAGGLWAYQQKKAGDAQEITRQLMEGREQFIAKKYDKAEALLTPLAQPDTPNNEIAALWLVKTQLAVGKKDAAIESLAKVIPSSATVPSTPYASLLCLQAQWLAAGDARFAVCQQAKSDAAFASLQKEAQAIEKISAGDYDAAQSVLPTEGMTQAQSRRISDMKAYLTARTGKTEPEKDAHAQ
jgi:hypothetical protein